MQWETTTSHMGEHHWLMQLFTGTPLHPHGGSALLLCHDLSCKQLVGETCPSHNRQQYRQRGAGRMQTVGRWAGEICESGRFWGLTVKLMPTVEVKDPGMNLPWSYWTSREVLPTPLSPTRIVCRESHRQIRRHAAGLHSSPEASPPSGLWERGDVHLLLSTAFSDAVWQRRINWVSSGVNSVAVHFLNQCLCQRNLDALFSNLLHHFSQMGLTHQQDWSRTFLTAELLPFLQVCNSACGHPLLLLPLVINALDGEKKPPA